MADILLDAPPMRCFVMTGFLILGTVTVSACESGPSEVKASSYDQSCTVSSECVLVNELSVDDDLCSMGCGADGAVNTRAEPEYRRDLDENAGQCERMPGLDCETAKVAAQCVRGKCTVVTTP